MHTIVSICLPLYVHMHRASAASSAYVGRLCMQDAGRDAALDSLSAIVRGVASGHVRRYLEAQEAHWEVTRHESLL